MKNFSTLYAPLSLTLLLIFGLIFMLPKKISSFTECAKSHTVVGTYPMECTADGQTFTEGITIPKNTGLRGVVTVSSMCSADVASRSRCIAKPIRVELRAVQNESTFSKKFSSDDSGHYKVSLLPGDYEIIRAQECGKAYCSELVPNHATVVEGVYLAQNFTFEADSL